MIKYVHIPDNKAYYKAQEDCCYEIVNYDDENIGITSHIDDENRDINSWDLLCRCYPNVEMIEITEKDYEDQREEVCTRMKELGLVKDSCSKKD